MTRPIGTRPDGGGEPFPTFLPPPMISARAVDLVTSVAPPGEQLAIVDSSDGYEGLGSAVSLDAGTYELSAALFLSASANNARYWIQAQSEVDGGGWVDFRSPIVDSIGFAGATQIVNGLGIVTIPAGAYRFRWNVGLGSGSPGGSSITYETFDAILQRIR